MIIVYYILKVLGLALATEAFTEIGTSSDIIAPWQKRWKLWTYPLNVPPPENPTILQRFRIFVDSLWSCGYCFSVWVAGVFAFLGVYPSDASIWMCIPWWVVNWMVIHRLSNWLHVFFELVKRGRVRTYDIVLKIDEQSDESGEPDPLEGEFGTRVVWGDEENESRTGRHADAPDGVET